MYSWETHPPYTCTTLLATFKVTALFFVCQRTMSEMKSCISSILKKSIQLKRNGPNLNYRVGGVSEYTFKRSVFISDISVNIALGSVRPSPLSQLSVCRVIVQMRSIGF